MDPPPVRVLGPDALPVSAIGFGAMALSFRTRPSEDEAIGVIHAVLDAGVTLVDTADVYAPDERQIGHSERLIAKALRAWGGQRANVVVATKGGYTRRHGQLVPDGSPSHLMRACEASLRRLGTEVIDLYQLHTPDPRIPFTDSVGALRDLLDAGKIRRVGLSNVTAVQIDAARRIAPIQSVQNPLSVLRRDSLRVGPVARLERRGVRGIRQLRRLVREPFQSGVLARCARLELGFLAYSPLGGARNRVLVDDPALQRLARARGTSVHALAMAWVLAQGERVVPIPSARTVAHALDTLTAAHITLTEDELRTLGRRRG